MSAEPRTSRAAPAVRALLVGLAIVRPASSAGPDFSKGPGQASADVNASLPPPNIVFSAGTSDQVLTVPSGATIIPDEHTTIVPIFGPKTNILPGPPPVQFYRFYIATNNKPGAPNVASAVMESKDLVHFEFEPGYGVASRGDMVMWSPSGFQDCNYTGPTVYDQNYAAPGSVVQDPTLSAGHLIMVYEAEQHCPGGAGGTPEFPFWASVGLARSADNGKTWPQPGNYGNERYAILQIPGTEPATPHPSWGDAIPSAFVDDIQKGTCTGITCPKTEPHLYVVYSFVGSTSTVSDGYLRIARAKLGGTGKLQFKKWYVPPGGSKGSFSQDGIGGSDSGFTASKGCAEPSYQSNGAVSWNDALKIYMFTYVCVNLQKQSDGTYQRVQAAWYYSTATSLDQEDWSVPQLIENTQSAVTNDWIWDGWYPSFMSPGCEPGHLGLSGKVFLLDGSPVAARVFRSRNFKITAGLGLATLTGDGCAAIPTP